MGLTKLVAASALAAVVVFIGSCSSPTDPNLGDGVPSYVEAHLDDWIANVGYFCPWSAELVALKDYR
jgi:hypothetical protein